MEKVNLVILFCDIHKFARLALGLGDRMPSFVQAYYDVVGDAVAANGGRLLKYMGDSVLAVFPAERTAAAVTSALLMRKEYARLARQSGTGVDSDLGIAIGWGPVIHGIFGHSSLRNEDVFGETVNETAMLLHARGVALSREAREAVGDRFPLEKLPDVALKWRQEPLEAWRVLEAG